jgi:mono/diheme cytochrome c family protein
MRGILNHIALLFAIAGLTTAASRAGEGDFFLSPSAEDVAFYESRVRPLFAKHCYECHASDSKLLQGGLRLDDGPAALAGGDSGIAIVPGKPAESRLIAAVSYDSAGIQMPPAGKLSDPEIADLTEWIARGAPFPADASEPGGEIARREIDIDAGRGFWSFQPLARHTPPLVHNAGWVERPADGFVLARIEEAGLTPAPVADRRTLIRRAAFDLTGLPPTPDDVSSFVADAASDAWPRLVDRLLSSPHYGERWGRFWLDLVRYCDVPESWAETGGQAWLYRDWVVRALNEDLPYDRFVVLQLAADQMPDNDPRNVAALGLLGLSPSYWKELKLAPGVIQTVIAEEWEERIGALSGTLLGLTVGCARCHDHKFDPVTQQDYYALAGVLASIRQTPLPMLPKEQAQAVGAAHLEVKALEGEIERLKALAARERDKADALQRQIEEAQARIAELKSTPNYDAPLAYAVEDAALHVLPDGTDRTRLDYRVGEAQDVALQVRGNPLHPGPVTPRRFLAVLSSGEPEPFRRGSGRIDLARAIFRDGAPLAARVIVNRVWAHHFGRGLVDTPSNFGAQGSPPTHPELLEDLTARFVSAGWSLKWLHREIMLSATYQQASIRHEAGEAIDPDNRLLWRANRRRLEVEAWRDAMLAVTGRLDVAIGGPAQDLSAGDNSRRTLYGIVKRRELNDLLRLYDFPDPTGHSPARVPTTTPLQQLFLLNSDFSSSVSAALVERIHREFPGDPARQIRRAYELLFQRPANRDEVAIGMEFLSAGAPHAAEEAWRQYCQVLLGSNEFLFID